MVCSNVGGSFKSNGYTLNQRRGIFYGVCVPVRLLLAYLAWYLATTRNGIYAKKLGLVVFVLSAIAVYTIYNCLDDETVWFSRRFHLTTSLILLVVSGLVVTDNIDATFISYVLLVDVLVGALSAVFLQN